MYHVERGTGHEPRDADAPARSLPETPALPPRFTRITPAFYPAFAIGPMCGIINLRRGVPRRAVAHRDVKRSGRPRAAPVRASRAGAARGRPDYYV